MDISTQIFECCKEMDKLCFPKRHRDESYYYIRPDILIRMDEIDSLRNNSKYSYASFDGLIYQPTLEDLVEYVQPNDINFSMTNGVYVSRTWNGAEYRTNAITLWLALAGNWITIEKEKDKSMTDIKVSGDETSDLQPLNKLDI